MMARKIGLIVFMLWVFFPGRIPVLAQDPIEVLGHRIESEFRDHITAYISVRGSAEITNAEFFYRIAGQQATSKNVAEFEPGNEIETQVSIDQTAIYFPPGAELEYWWKITDADDNVLKTDKELYVHLDNRHPFETLSNERVTLYWYEGDEDFGQALFDQANKGLDQLEENVGVTIEDPVKIFIYGNHDDLMNAIAVGAQEWTGGQAFTEFGVVVMGVSPFNLSWGLKATTHELTHLIIHQATDNPYGDLPRWLDEGLAVYNEDPSRLDAQFRDSFEAAANADALMTLQTLSSTFPADSQEANLAYGESGAVVKFIIDTYGSDAMSRLLDIFSEGALYDKALEEALGVDTRGLDNAWRDSLGLPPLSVIEPEAQPIIQADEELKPVSESKPELVATTIPAEEPKAQPTQNESAAPQGKFPCLAGWIPLVAVGLMVGGRNRNRLIK